MVRRRRSKATPRSPRSTWAEAANELVLPPARRDRIGPGSAGRPAECLLWPRPRPAGRLLHPRPRHPRHRRPQRHGQDDAVQRHHRPGGRLRQHQARRCGERRFAAELRSEEHTSELQSLRHLVCRLLLEKKKKTEKKFLHLTKQKNKKVQK